MALAEGFIDALAFLEQMRSQRANMVDNQVAALKFSIK